jgi:hypothetical protein
MSEEDCAMSESSTVKVKRLRPKLLSVAYRMPGTAIASEWRTSLRAYFSFSPTSFSASSAIFSASSNLPACTAGPSRCISLAIGETS